MRLPVSWPTLRMLLAVGVLYLVMMGSTFSSLGVVLPYMIAELHLSWGQAGFGFTLLALAAGLSSVLPAVLIKRWNARVTLGVGVLVLMAAYALLAATRSVVAFDAGALLLGIGFSLVGAVPALHILSGWEVRRRALVFGCYLAFGGAGGGCWPSVVEWAVAAGGWRFYWWFMVGLMALVGGASCAVVRERAAVAGSAGGSAGGAAGGGAGWVGSGGSGAGGASGSAWTLGEALRTPQFYIVACGIASTYLVASTVNAFTVSYLTLLGVGTAVAVVTFSVQSACHAAFPIFMGGIADRVGVKTLLVVGLLIQAVGMVALGVGSSRWVLMIFAIGVGGGYGTVFLGTTLTLQEYFGTPHYANIFGANQLFTTVSVVGPVLVGAVADQTGRFDVSFFGCAALLGLTALATAWVRRPDGARQRLGRPLARHDDLHEGF